MQRRNGEILTWLNVLKICNNLRVKLEMNSTEWKERDWGSSNIGWGGSLHLKKNQRQPLKRVKNSPI